MKHVRIGFILLAFLLAGMALVPMASADTLTAQAFAVKSGSNTIYFGGSGLLSPGTASFMGIGCTLYDDSTGSQVDYTGATKTNTNSISTSKYYSSCITGRHYTNTCGVYTFTPYYSAEASQGVTC